VCVCVCARSPFASAELFVLVSLKHVNQFS